MLEIYDVDVFIGEKWKVEQQFPRILILVPTSKYGCD